MNWILLLSSAFLIAVSVEFLVSDPFSIREIVFAVTPDFSAKSRTDHFSAALAIRNCSGFIVLLSKLVLTLYL